MLQSLPSLRANPSDDEAVDLECGLTAEPQRLNQQLMERDLILAFDSQHLRRNEAWFLVESKWLDAWMSYVIGDNDDANASERPGPLRNDTLFDREEFRVRDNLLQTRDYRGVNPQVYALYAELYGTDNAKPIVRWTLDIYAMPVMIDDVREMLLVPTLKARSLVTEMMDELQSHEKGLQGLAPRAKEQESWVYRCLCRCEFLIPCLNRFLGGGPTYKREEATSWGDSFCCCRRKRGRRKDAKTKEEEKSCDETSSDEETHGLLG